VAIEERYGAIMGAAQEIFARRGYHQASIREIAKAADLSLAGLYHYIGGKDELLFFVISRALDDLLSKLDAALTEAPTPEATLQTLIHTHLDFAFHHGPALKIINRDIELLPESRRSEVVAKRHAYMLRGLEVLRELDGSGRTDDELFSATNLLLGMLNGIATRPFVGRGESRTLAIEVADLFLHGFLGGVRAATD
jgi:AcrR family transcriptional regulator